MNIDQELGDYTPGGETVLTIGVFDGVHRGHLHLISQLTALAMQTRRLAGVVTFRNHPAAVLKPDFRPSYLTSVEERSRLLQDLDVDFIIPVTFDREISLLRAGQFAALLRDRLRMKALVIGPDFTMGHKREGNAEALVALGGELGFTVNVVEPLNDEDGHPVRSTTIREALAEGDLPHVSELLGRDFTLAGTVVKGAGRGGPLGFPTANLAVDPGMAVPGDGIYAAWANIGPTKHMAATSIGVRPTFEDSGHAIEVFMLDFEDDLYGKEVRLEFVTRLRDEVKFDTVEALQEQVREDIDQIRAVLGAVPSDEEHDHGHHGH